MHLQLRMPKLAVRFGLAHRQDLMDLQTQMQGQYTSLIQQLVSLLHTQLITLKHIIDELHVRVELEFDV